MTILFSAGSYSFPWMAWIISCLWTSTLHPRTVSVPPWCPQYKRRVSQCRVLFTNFSLLWISRILLVYISMLHCPLVHGISWVTQRM
ncbi:hypothetical protein M432DRAFT_615650 [Thermoascus aurantiacus ATCC 26904]